MITLTHNEVQGLVEKLAWSVALDPKYNGKRVAVYGIPRGGVVTAYALVGCGVGSFELAETPDLAMIFVDDIVDSGATRNEWGRAFPDVPFYALVDKSQPDSPYRDKWVIFPWENPTGTKDDTIVGTLWNRLQKEGHRFFANDSILPVLHPGDLAQLEAEVARRVDHLLRGLIIDVDHDHNTQHSAKRLAKMYMREVFKGRYTPPPTTVDFPNVGKLDEMYVTGPITVRSGCSHHFVPIMGHCWIGVIPGDRVIGLSKFNRIVEWIAARPQIQEELVVQVADYLERQVKPKGLAVVIRATHMCMTWRGVREPMEAQMTSSVMRGLFREHPEAKAEFMSLIQKR
jgi:GTP cyclohydrolase IA